GPDRTGCCRVAVGGGQVVATGATKRTPRRAARGGRPSQDQTPAAAPAPAQTEGWWPRYRVGPAARLPRLVSRPARASGSVDEDLIGELYVLQRAKIHSSGLSAGRVQHYRVRIPD